MACHSYGAGFGRGGHSAHPEGDPRKPPECHTPRLPSRSDPSTRSRLLQERGAVADRLIVRGAREHNLKDVSLDLPRDAMIVFTGLSRFGQVQPGLRYYFRRRPAAVRRIAVRLRPAVPGPDGQARRRLHRRAVARGLPSTRSPPAATRVRPSAPMTEVYDYLRLLFARVGKPHCPICGRPIARQTPQQIVDRVHRARGGHPVPGARPGRSRPQGRVHRAAASELQAKGYSRARVDGTIIRLDEVAGDAGSLPDAEEAGKARDRGGHRPARGEGHRPTAADRLDRDRARPRRAASSSSTSSTCPETDPHRERMFSEHLGLPL